MVDYCHTPVSPGGPCFATSGIGRAERCATAAPATTVKELRDATLETKRSCPAVRWGASGGRRFPPSDEGAQGGAGPRRSVLGFHNSPPGGAAGHAREGIRPGGTLAAKGYGLSDDTGRWHLHPPGLDLPQGAGPGAPPPSGSPLPGGGVLTQGEAAEDLFEPFGPAAAHRRGQGVPPYVVFPDSTLRALCRLRPSTPEEFLEVPGVGESKLRRYGDRFLQLLSESP
jgi:ATP-dependent DNA helicase RecQ